MNAIGGYMGLELANGQEYHAHAICLNTGRTSLQYILQANTYTKIYIPYFTCDVILEPIKNLKFDFEFYNINKDFEPVFNFSTIKEDEVFLYTNYFGLKNRFIKELSKTCKNLIIDNAQAFFAPQIKGVDTFYSARKFFGVSDGAYLYSNKKLSIELEKDISYNRGNHLFRRIDQSAEDGYIDFQTNEKSLQNAAILSMSNLTKHILQSINYESVISKRRENYKYLSEAIGSGNDVSLHLEDNVPMTYPFYSNELLLRERLIKNKVYVALYWPNVPHWVNKESVEYNYATKLIHLPIDQRISKKELDFIINIITNEH